MKNRPTNQSRLTSQLTAVGITCGVGSMLVGARAAGFRVLGNVEWRRYYHDTDAGGRNTFTENFPGAVFPHSREQMTEEEFRRFSNPDIALGHPECGNFSQLGGTVRGHEKKLEDPTDIPLFVDLVAQFRPRFFVMDDLPRSFGAFPIEEYVRRLPDYDLFPEWVSNWGYGNIQRHRNRMFMLGALKQERWVFVPGEREHGGTLETCIGDLSEPSAKSNISNHYPTARHERAQKSLSLRFRGDRPTWEEVGAYARENWRQGQSMTYHAEDGTVKLKPGCKIEHWGERGASVQDGGSYKLHPVRFDNLTIRERARIQGFPDDFIFYGARLNEAGEYNPDKNVHMAKQTGKAMPVEFCTYVSHQVAAHIRRKPWESSGARLLPPNEWVSTAKMEFCRRTPGYADQERACGACWQNRYCHIRHQKYGIGRPAQVPAVAAEKPVEAPRKVRATPAGERAPITPRTSARRFVDLPAGLLVDRSFGK